MNRSACWWAVLTLAVSAPLESQAQGLLLKLPPDGTWVRYEGTYAQTEIRPETATGQLEITPWSEVVTIKSVGQETAEYQGSSVPCRWLEFKIERGRAVDGKINTGLSGLEIYKVLVPEPGIDAEFDVTAEDPPSGFLPIVKGFRKVGSGEPRALEAPALRLYPLAVLLSHARGWTVAESGVDPGVGIGAVQAEKLTGGLSEERSSSRSTTQMAVWTSPDVPFGIAAWTATIERSKKDDRQARTEFKPVTRIVVSLKAQGTGDNAQSELSTP
jgi:hypothetical protein